MGLEKVNDMDRRTLATHHAVSAEAVTGCNGLSREERELAGIVVARTVRCGYARERHAAALERLLPARRRAVAGLIACGLPARLEEREAAIVGVAERMARPDARATLADLRSLRAAGLQDSEVLELVRAIAYFVAACNVLNRQNDAGVESEVPGAGKPVLV